MTTLKWIVTRLITALVMGLILLLLVWYVLFPMGISIAYRVELPIDEFIRQESGAGAAGSSDAMYFTARYSCRNAVTTITGHAPDANYWMFGIYDNRLLRIPGGHLNGDTIDINENGNYEIRIQSGPGNAQNTLECYRGGSGIIIMRVFLPEDRDAIQTPIINRQVGVDW
jgi:uncharacterized membrane protein